MTNQQTKIKLLQAADSAYVDTDVVNDIVGAYYEGSVEPTSKEIDDAIRLASQAIKDLQTVKRILGSL